MLGWALLTIVFAKADHDINGFHAGPYVTAFLTNIYLAKVIYIMSYPLWVILIQAWGYTSTESSTMALF